MLLPFYQIDAFADAPFTGNPAAVLPLERWLEDDILQAIAAENNLAETAFFVPTPEGTADYHVRWFTPTTEVALCGHATLASGFQLLRDGPPRGAVHFQTNDAGVLTVARDGARYSVDLPCWRPEPLADAPVPAWLGRCEAQLRHPRGYRVFVVREAAALRALTPGPDMGAGTGDDILIVTAPGPTAGADRVDFVSRVFAPAAGIDEDAVTGSAHAVIAPYWADRLGRDLLAAYQASPRGGRLTCRLADDRVILEGGCRLVIEGSFLL